MYVDRAGRCQNMQGFVEIIGASWWQWLHVKIRSSLNLNWTYHAKLTSVSAFSHVSSSATYLGVIYQDTELNSECKQEIGCVQVLQFDDLHISDLDDTIQLYGRETVSSNRKMANVKLNLTIIVKWMAPQTWHINVKRVLSVDQYCVNVFE